MALSYNEKENSYTRTDDNGKALGTVYSNDSTEGRFDNIAKEYTAQESAKNTTTTEKPLKSGYDQYKETLDIYQASLDKANKAATDSQIASLRNQITDVTNAYTDADKQAYVAKMQSEKNLGQQLAAAGLGQTGMSESSYLANNVNWANNVNSNAQAKEKAIRDLQNQIAGVQANGQLQTAQQAYDNGAALANLQMQLGQQTQAQDNWQAEFDYNKALQDKAAAEDQKQTALALLGNGYTPAQVAYFTGLSEDMVKQFVLAPVAPTYSGGSSGSTSKSSGSSGSGSSGASNGSGFGNVSGDGSADISANGDTFNTYMYSGLQSAPVSDEQKSEFLINLYNAGQITGQKLVDELAMMGIEISLP